MTELLYLCHRIPYPPNKGDKIRAFNWLRALSQRYTVHLGSFVDDPDDWTYEDDLARWCDRICLLPIHVRRAKLRSLAGMGRGRALSFGYYFDRRMQDWVDTLLRERHVTRVLVFSSTMAPYVVAHRDRRRVIDFVDVDSDKWAQYAGHARWPMRWVYSREARTLADGERRLAEEFDASVFVSQTEGDFFRRQAPVSADKVHAIANGVDTDYFDPAGSYPNPFADVNGPCIVFTGAMNYGANEDAVCWFVEQAFGAVREAVPDARFFIVGLHPTKRVARLAGKPGVVVTGSVPDVRPYLAHARVAVAPMRIARGLQNKVLEALAMALPVVMSPQAASGLEPDPANTDFCRVVAAADAFAAAVTGWLRDPVDERTQSRARQYILSNYSWQSRYADLDRLLDNRVAAPVPQEVIA